ncbi:MAG: porin [Sedimenticola sp.]
MNKKLLSVAMAAALFAPAAMADVTVSGFVLQEFVTDGDDTGASEDGLESHSDVGVVLTASEDLGNGMTAFAKIDIGKDDGGTANNDQIVGISSGFGTIVIGRMEDFTEGKVAAMASVDSSDALSVEPLSSGTFDVDTGRLEGAMAYVSPNMGGFQVGVAAYALENGGTAASDYDSNLDAYDIMLGYSNGGITVRLSREEVEDTVAGQEDKTTTALGAEFKTGAFRVVGVYMDQDDDTDTEGWMLGMNYTMGNNVFGIGLSDEEQGTNERDRWILDFTHNMSKRTKVYATYQADETNNVDDDRFAIGMKHSF